MSLLSHLLGEISASLRVEGSAHVLAETDEEVALADLGHGWRVAVSPSLEEMARAIASAQDRLLVVVAPLRAQQIEGATNIRPIRGEEMPASRLLRDVTREQGHDRYVGAFIPGRFLGSPKQRTLREQVADAMYPKIVIEGSSQRFLQPRGALQIALVSSDREALGALVVFGDGKFAARPTRFFILPDEDTPDDDIVRDFEKLLSQPSGRTRYGWVYEDKVDASQSLGAARYSPESSRLRQELLELGDVVSLLDIAEFVPTVDPSGDLPETVVMRAVPLLQGREIHTGGRIRPLVDRLFTAPSERQLLKEGDLCVRSTVGARHDRLAVAAIDASLLPMAASNDVVVVRLGGDVDDALRPFIEDYLRSPRALRLIRPVEEAFELNAQDLGACEIPLPSAALKTTLIDLWRAELTTAGFLAEIKKVRASLVESVDEPLETAIPRVLRSGRLIHQRLAAAESMNHLPSRLRQRLPYPLAHLWRTFETGRSNLESYVRILELAEAVTAYLGTLVVVASRAAQVEMQSLAGIAGRLQSGSAGMTFGDWSSIVDEAQGARFRRAAGVDLPIPELTGCLAVDSDAGAALLRLRARRNDNAHGRGPRGDEIFDQIDAASSDLEKVLDASEFLTEYPLRLIDETRWDSLDARNIYAYRDLMGDHPLVEQSRAVSPRFDLEANSLYVVDRAGDLRLLRPLLLREKCDTCGVVSTFLLDRVLANDVCALRALEDGHTIERTGLFAGLVALGLLPETAS